MVNSKFAKLDLNQNTDREVIATYRQSKKESYQLLKWTLTGYISLIFATLITIGAVFNFDPVYLYMLYAFAALLLLVPLSLAALMFDNQVEIVFEDGDQVTLHNLVGLRSAKSKRVKLSNIKHAYLHLGSGQTKSGNPETGDRLFSESKRMSFPNFKYADLHTGSSRSKSATPGVGLVLKDGRELCWFTVPSTNEAVLIVEKLNTLRKLNKS